MGRRWGETGKIQLGCLVVILLWGMVGYLAYRIVPVYLEKDAFYNELLKVAGDATKAQWSNRKVVQRVIEAAKRHNFETSAEEISVDHIRGRPEVVVTVTYRRTEEFPGGYIYVFHFRSVGQGSLGL